MEGAHPVQKPGANTGPLPLRHDDKPGGAEPFDFKPWRDGKVRDKLAVNHANKVFGGNRPRKFQIIMRLKERPVTGIDLPNFQFDSWAFIRAAALTFFIICPVDVSKTQSGSSQSRMS